MGNIFLFRHGQALNPDSDDEMLSPKGIEQAQKAGKDIAGIMNERYGLLRKKEISHEEFGGLLKAHSGTKRTSSFLEQILSIIEDNFNQIPLSFYEDIIDVSSSKIYKRDGDNKINDIVERFYPLAKTQIIVGHNPGTAKVVKNYVDEKGFNFQGEEGFLRATPEGSGYWINTIEKTVKTISDKY